MNPFVAVVDLEGLPLGAEALTHALPALAAAQGRLELSIHDSWAAGWVPSGSMARPAIGHRDGILALGDVRVSNREHLWHDVVGSAVAGTDLDLVAALFAAKGADAVRRLIGDFGFVLWDLRRGTLVAARDALGVKPLFWRRDGQRITVASHLDCIEQTGYDTDYFAEFIAGRSVPERRTAFAGIERLPPGSWLVAEGRRTQHQVFWSPGEFTPAVAADPSEAVTEFTALFDRAVEAQLEEDPGLAGAAPGRDDRVWAELSGGLDSSSVVATACGLGARGVGPGIAGTLTVVDSLGDGDETRFSDAVAARYGLPNERVVDYWPWQADAEGPSAAGGPRHFLPYFARDREVGRRVKAAGGTVLLSGYGADQYLSGGFDFVADDLAGGRWKQAATTVLDLAVTTRDSFWKLGWVHGLSHFRRRGSEYTSRSLPAWLDPGLGRQVAELPASRPGSIFSTAVRREVAAVDAFLDRGPLEHGVEVRYPFLHRPLVEFCLRLPPALRVRPLRQKWILREAMSQRLPAAVLARTGKGGITSRVVWALQREEPVLRHLIANSPLAAMGVIDGKELTAAFERTKAGLNLDVTSLLTTLALDTWLAMRSGWWTRHGTKAPAAGVTAAARPIPKESAYDQQAVVP